MSVKLPRILHEMRSGCGCFCALPECGGHTFPGVP